VAEDLKRVRYQLERATATDRPAERLSRHSDNPPRLWQLRDKLTEEDVAEIARDWRAWATQLGLAQKFGVSQPSVRRLLIQQVELHSDARPPKLLAERFTPEQLEKIITSYCSGVRQREIVATYGISASALKRLLRDAGARRCDP
jgi:hypothetical protein